jgi:hypothetical protein
MILWFLNIGHSGTLFGMWFLTLVQQLFLLILSSLAEYVELMGNGEGYIQVMYIAKLKDGPKRVKKFFSMTLERVFEMV